MDSSIARTGGAQTTLAGVALDLDRTRFQVHVTCLYGAGATAQRLRAGGVPVTDLTMRSTADLGVVARLWRLVRQERPTILLSNRLETLTAAGVAGATEAIGASSCTGWARGSCGYAHPDV